MDKIAEIERLLAEATPGPWQIGRMGNKDQDHVVDMGKPPEAPFMVSYGPRLTGQPFGVCHSDDDSSAKNAALIVTLHNEAPRLIARVRELEKALEPFAAAAEDIDEDELDRSSLWEHPASMNVTVGDFRAARASVGPK